MTLTLEPLPAEEYSAWREGVIGRRSRSPRWRGIPEEMAVQRAREILDRHLPPAAPTEGTEVLTVEADGRRAGSFFVIPRGGTTVQLGDLVLADPADAAAVRGLLVARLRERGIATLGVGVSTGDPAAAAFVDGARTDLVATQMQLDLATSAPSGAARPVTLRPMTAGEVSAYFADAIDSFADETIQADPTLTREEALASSREMHEQILPQGLETPGHDFLVALADDARRVGMTWLFHEERASFVYDVEVDEAERGKGYGRALMDAAADHARELGSEVLGLNVFGHNEVAMSLYGSLGFTVLDRSLNLSVE